MKSYLRYTRDLIFIFVLIGSVCGASPKSVAGKAPNHGSDSVVAVKRNGGSNITNCLSSKDYVLVRKFLKNFKYMLDKHDTAGIVDIIAFPLEIGLDMTVGREEFIATYYETVAHYLLRSTIDKSEISDLKRTEGFEKIDGKSGCFRYKILNAFPELEFDVYFHLEKRDGRLKIVSLRIIG
jgi:hypothetical protein